MALARLERGFGLLLYGLLALAILGTLAGIGYSIRKAGMDAVRAEWAEANRQAREKEAAQAGKAAEKLEAKREKAKVIYRTITKEVDKIVERPVYRSVCLDTDGLRLARCAIRGQDASACKPDKPVPAPAGSGGRDGRLDLAMDYRLGGSLP